MILAAELWRELCATILGLVCCSGSSHSQNAYALWPMRTGGFNGENGVDNRYHVTFVFSLIGFDDFFVFEGVCFVLLAFLYY